MLHDVADQIGNKPIICDFSFETSKQTYSQCLLPYDKLLLVSRSVLNAGIDRQQVRIWRPAWRARLKSSIVTWLANWPHFGRQKKGQLENQ